MSDAGSSPLSARDFRELLDGVSSLDDRKKRLWINIYSNAVDDRARAIEVYDDLRNIAAGKSTELAVHGKAITTTIEKMSRANDQLLKLVELVQSEDDEQGTSDDDVYEKIRASAQC